VEAYQRLLGPGLGVLTGRCAGQMATPVGVLLDSSTKLILRLFSLSPESDSAVTQEEVKTIVAEAEASGAIESGERDMIAGVLRLGDRAVRGIMTPRTDVDRKHGCLPAEAVGPRSRCPE
jgi:CBS domain containing-hemolysin-like protein